MPELLNKDLLKNYNEYGKPIEVQQEKLFQLRISGNKPPDYEKQIKGAKERLEELHMKRNARIRTLSC